VSEYVTDTHALIWHLTGVPRLSTIAAKIFADTDAGLHRIHIPSIVLVEMIYLVDKERIAEALLDRVLALLKIPHGSYAVAPLDSAVAQAMRRVPRDTVPDMPDRIIVATACHLGLPLLSKDLAIGAVEGLDVVW